MCGCANDTHVPISAHNQNMVMQRRVPDYRAFFVCRPRYLSHLLSYLPVCQLVSTLLMLLLVLLLLLVLRLPQVLPLTHHQTTPPLISKDHSNHHSKTGPTTSLPVDLSRNTTHCVDTDRPLETSLWSPLCHRSKARLRA